MSGNSINGPWGSKPKSRFIFVVVAACLGVLACDYHVYIHRTGRPLQAFGAVAYTMYIAVVATLFG
jgi:hypothetical protein